MYVVNESAMIDAMYAKGIRTIDGLAEAAGLHRHVVEKICNGFDGGQRMTTVMKLADALGVKPSVLIQGGE